MNVFGLHNLLIQYHSFYISSFIRIPDSKIKNYVDQSIDQGLLWHDPLIQLNPTFEPGRWIDDLVNEDVLHKDCKRIFRRKQVSYDFGQPLRLHKHREDALRIAREGQNYILMTGTESEKSLTYILLLVRFRYHVIQTWNNVKKPLLAEDCRTLAFSGNPQSAVWTDKNKAEKLLLSQPNGNIAADQATELVGRVVDGYELLRSHLNQTAIQRCEELLEAHQRVRLASNIRSTRYRVEPQLPPIILGLHILLPQFRGRYQSNA